MGATLQTATRAKPNKILGIAGTNVIVGTTDSPEGAPVPLAMIQEGLDQLIDSGQVRIAPESFSGRRRSSAVGAILATLASVEVSGTPAEIRLAQTTPLRDCLSAAFTLTTAARSADAVVASDLLSILMTQELPKVLRAVVADERGYKVQGSAGQLNLTWAETPWAAVLDQLVTDSPQRGHYLVYLIHREGKGVFLSLNQGITDVRLSRGADFQEHLRSRAEKMGTFLDLLEVGDLPRGPIDLAGKGQRTRAYENASVVSVFYSSDDLPHDAVLVSDLRRFLALYTKLTAKMDESDATQSNEAPAEAKTGLESRRYRWHLRAEGRNSAVAREAKRIHGYTCQVCSRDFRKDLGPLGEACIDAHHLTPFSAMDRRPRKLDPKTDFAVVCSNCHRMLHTETPPMPVQQLVKKLDSD
jgi:5-methylcytosine-specific restriction enzyme A